MVTLREQLERAGAWPALREDLRAMFARTTRPADGGVDFVGEYLVVVGRRVN